MLIEYIHTKVITLFKDKDNKTTIVFKYKKQMYYGEYTFTKYINLNDCVLLSDKLDSLSEIYNFVTKG